MGRLKVFGIIVVVLFILLILSLLILDFDSTYENQLILLIMNTFFTGVVPIIVAAIAARAYLQENGTGALLMGCGMLVFGLGSMITGILRCMPDSANVSVTVYNTCALIGAGCHLWASQLSQEPRVCRILPKWLNLGLALTGVFVFVAGLTIAALHGLTPVFFDEYGSTPIRDIVLWSAIALYFGASIAFFGKHKETRTSHLYWYSLALLMIALGLFGVSVTTGVGTPIGWAGRAGQYTGAVFAWISMAAIWNKAKKEGVNVADVMADFFSDAEGSYKNLTEHTPSAILSVGEDFQIFFVNTGALRLFRTKRRELVNSSFLDLFGEGDRERIRQDFRRYVDSGIRGLRGPAEIQAMDKRGRVFDAEVSISYRRMPGGYAGTYIIQDITERKKAEERISRQNTILHVINHVYERAIHCERTQELAKDCIGIVQRTMGSQYGLIAEVRDNKLYSLAINRPKIAQYGIGEDGDLSGCPLRGLYALILNGGKSIMINAPDRRLSDLPDWVPPVSSFLGVPFKRGGQIFGIICVTNKEDGFAEHDKEVLEAITPTILEVLLHKRAEERLRDSEARFTAFMNSTPLLALIKDEAGRHVFLNKTWEKLYDRKIKDALGKTNLDLLSRENAEKIREGHERVLRTGRVYEETLPIRRASKETQYWQVVRFPFKSSSGKAYTGCIGIDITERKRTREDLARSESLLRDVMEGINNPVCLKDRQCRIIMGNSALSESMGLPLHRLLGRTDLEVGRDKEKARLLMENDRRILTSGAVQSFEETVPTPKGMRTYLSTKTPWRDSQGNVIGIIGVAQDITERKEMETALKQQTEDLKQKNKLITDFFINISHEFKTPIAVLTLGMELMEESAKENPDIGKHLGIMRLNAYRLGRLVSNLLDITKLDAGFMEPNWEHVDIVHILRDLSRSTEYYVNQKDMTLTFACNADEKHMSTDGFILERIMLNLLSNAIKHTRAGGSIHVGCLTSDNIVRISVADTGEGIPEDKKQIIFNRFMQVDTSLTRASEGCGIGLALTKSLVELLKGTISFESIYGEGTEFTVELPVLPMKIQPQCVVESGMGLHKRIQMEFSDLDFNFG